MLREMLLFHTENLCGVKLTNQLLPPRHCYQVMVFTQVPFISQEWFMGRWVGRSVRPSVSIPPPPLF